MSGRVSGRGRGGGGCKFHNKQLMHIEIMGTHLPTAAAAILPSTSPLNNTDTALTPHDTTKIESHGQRQSQEVHRSAGVRSRSRSESAVLAGVGVDTISPTPTPGRSRKSSRKIAIHHVKLLALPGKYFVPMIQSGSRRGQHSFSVKPFSFPLQLKVLQWFVWM